jgi:hypothetical protein
MRITRWHCTWIDCKEPGTQNYAGVKLCLRHRMTAEKKVLLGPYTRLATFVKPFAVDRLRRDSPRDDAGGVGVSLTAAQKSAKFVARRAGTGDGSRDLSETRFLYGGSPDGKKRNWNDR